MRKTLLFILMWGSMLSLFAQSEAEMQAFDQQNEVASLLVEGRYDAAIQQLEVLADRYKSLEAWENYFAILNQVTQLYLETDRLVEAKETAKKALWESLQRLGGSNDEAAKAAHKLAEVYAMEKRYPKAMECHHTALEIRFKLFGEIHPSIANSYDRMAATKLKAKDYSAAWDYYDLALHKREQIFGAHHPEIAQSFFNIGKLFSEQNKWAEALDYHEKALQLRVQELPEQDTKIAESLVQTNRIRAVMDKGVRLEELRRAAQLYETSQEKSSLAAALAYYELSKALLAHGHLKEAAQNAVLAVDISKKRHEQLLAYQTTLAEIYFYGGEYANSRQVLIPILEQIPSSERVAAYRQLIIGLLREQQWEHASTYATEYLNWLQSQPHLSTMLVADARLLAAKVYMGHGLSEQAWAQLPLGWAEGTLPERLESDLKQTEAAFRLQEKKYDEAMGLYQELLNESVPEQWDLNYWANLQLAYIYRQRAEQDINSIFNFGKAIEYFKKADYWLNKCPAGAVATLTQEEIWNSINDLYAAAIGSCYGLFQQTQNKEHIDLALFFSSRSKQWEKVIWACQMPAEWWSSPAAEAIAAWQGHRNAYAREWDKAYIQSLWGEQENTGYFQQSLDSLQLSTKKLAKMAPDYQLLLHVEDYSNKGDFGSYLRENQYLYAYFWGKNEVYIFQVSDKARQMWRLALDDHFKKALDNYIDFSNGKSMDQQQTLEAGQVDYNEFADAASFLFQKLLPNLVLVSEEKNRIDLILIPDGPLYYLPFESLLTSPSERSNFAALPYLIYSAHLYISPYLNTIFQEESSNLWPFIAHPAYINQVCWGEQDKALINMAAIGGASEYPVCQTAMAGILPLQRYQVNLPDKTQNFWLADFFQKMEQGEGSAQALREAKIEYLEEQANTPGKAHPHYWATFISPGLPDSPLSKQLHFMFNWLYTIPVALLLFLGIWLRFRRARNKIAVF